MTLEQRLALNLPGTYDRPGPAPVPRGIDIAGHSSIGGTPFRGAAVTTTDNTPEGR